MLSLEEFNGISEKIDKVTIPSVLLRELFELKILQKARDSENPKEKTLLFDLIFLKNLKTSICGFDKSLDDTISYSREYCSNIYNTKQKKKSTEFLSKNFLERWQFMLSIIVNSSEMSKEAPKKVMSNLLLSGVLKMSDDDTREISITSYGFKFLMGNLKSQVVTFVYHMIVWLNISQQIPVSTSLIYLTLLSQHPLQIPISITSLIDDKLSTMLEVLREVGLIYMKSSQSQIFYCAPILRILTSQHEDELSSDVDPAQMIVESNFRVYGHNLNSLQMSLVGLFCEILSVFPSMLVCRITRESIHQAYSFGISSKQIIDFLVHYMKAFKASKNLTADNDTIPYNVIDQLHVWEKERDRLHFTSGVLYTGFNHVKDFEDIVRYAESNNYLVYQNKTKLLVVVTDDGHDDVRSYWKSRRGN
ncbi:General transcription factor IIH subunit 4 [Thelohanellus kitauei]|uniref:General transcription factor IIH subunit 4 n=1 Tax=Thelohanellus kitauei TaxID=669202 RepID=A0A0C2MER1_THEKT|nr:General transcription factor IIH subunit 4 [Thelohanellus kitauei]